MNTEVFKCISLPLISSTQPATIATSPFWTSMNKFIGQSKLDSENLILLLPKQELSDQSPKYPLQEFIWLLITYSNLIYSGSFINPPHLVPQNFPDILYKLLQTTRHPPSFIFFCT